MSSSRKGQSMRKTSKTRGGKSDQTSGVYPEREALYWRERHARQPYAKNYSYEKFEHAYRTGYDTFFRYPGKSFDEVEKSVATEYEQAKPTAALPWDVARPAVNAVWEKMSGVIGPRDPDRGIRGSI